MNSVYLYSNGFSDLFLQDGGERLSPPGPFVSAIGLIIRVISNSNSESFRAK